jgi:hypothetical protein
MKKNKNSTVNYNFFRYLHPYSAQVILLLTLAFLRRRKETTSTDEDGVFNADIPKERGVV